ncbi:BA75_04690T0 [Komagataella pastoris]|uniref:BA75_04690T0 n=1 Tax=Komagataella pastoris TaxID=4922 RepID=A0A1B2JHT3_PICPA|nr:BA75_04690T0 [Komagataella pastoris]
MIIQPRDITLDVDNCADSCTDDITTTITTTITITRFNKAYTEKDAMSIPTSSPTAPVLDIVVEKRQFKSGSSQMITDSYSKSKGTMDAKTSTTLAIVIPICVLLLVSAALMLFYYMRRKQSEDSINPQILKEIRETKPTTLYINKHQKTDPDQIRFKDIPAKKIEAVSGFQNWKRQSIFNVKDWLDKRMSRDVSIRHVASSSIEESSSTYSEKDHHEHPEKVETPRGSYSQFYNKVINTPATNLRTFKLLNKSPLHSGIPRSRTPDSCNFHPSFIRNILRSSRDSTDLPQPPVVKNKDLPTIPLQPSDPNIQRQVIEVDTSSPIISRPQIAKTKHAEQRSTKKVTPLSLNGLEKTVNGTTSNLTAIYQVIENYTAKLPDEISIVKGELIILNGVFEDDWCRVNKVNSRMEGIVPRYCIARFT